MWLWHDLANTKKRLKALEANPSDAVGRTTAAGVVPVRLRVFRDREDFTGGQTLAEGTIAALDDSAALLVLCSSAASTRPVGQRRGQAVSIPASGAPGDPSHH